MLLSFQAFVILPLSLAFLGNGDLGYAGRPANPSKRLEGPIVHGRDSLLQNNGFDF
jgi:hypothetical protein